MDCRRNPARVSRLREAWPPLPVRWAGARLPAGALLLVACLLAAFLGVGCSSQDDPAEEPTTKATATRTEGAEAPHSGTQILDASEMVAASHILIMHSESKGAPPELKRTRAEANDLARRILVLMRTNRAWFEDLARKYSDDPRTADRGGYLGTFRRGDMLMAFEQAVFNLEEGEVGGPLETPYGFHVIRREPLRRVHARHILVAWRGSHKNDREISRSREKALDIVNRLHAQAVRDPDTFCELAMSYSDDPNNRAECGDLGWMEPGQLSPEIESVLFRLHPGEVSEVVESDYGFHVFRRE